MDKNLSQFNYIPETSYGNSTFKDLYKNSNDFEKLRALYTLYENLKDVLLNKRVGLDPLKVNDLLFNQNKFNDKQLNKFYRHLLNYTYASTALEVTNHEEVNNHLKEIHRLLKKLVKEDPVPAEPAATAGP